MVVSYLWGAAWVLWSLAFSILVQQSYSNNAGGDLVKHFAYGIFAFGAMFVVLASTLQFNQERNKTKIETKRHQELIDEIKKLTTLDTKIASRNQTYSRYLWYNHHVSRK
jgi:thiol:disulfide interchange protein